MSPKRKPSNTSSAAASTAADDSDEKSSKKGPLATLASGVAGAVKSTVNVVATAVGNIAMGATGEVVKLTHALEFDTNREFDYIVVGGGTAACVVAARLSEDPNVSVLLLERGSDTRTDISVKPTRYTLEVPPIPGPFMPMETNFVGPDPHLLAQQGFTLEYCSKTWGGGPAISGSFWGRGDPSNYDEWANVDGCTGWTAEECLPFFKISETMRFLYDPKTPISPDRGTSGPTNVSAIPMTSQGNILPQFAKTLQVPIITDSSTMAGQHGVSPMVRSLGPTIENPVRQSTYVTMVLPAQAEGRKNLVTAGQVTVIRVLFDVPKLNPAALPRATGVEYIFNGQTGIVRCKKEVILGAGALNTPKILMHSGVGEPLKLTSLGIPPIIALPGVGNNLTNHFRLQFNAQLKASVIPTPLRNGEGGANIAFFNSGYVMKNYLPPPSTDAKLKAATAAINDALKPALVGMVLLTPLPSDMLKPAPTTTAATTDSKKDTKTKETLPIDVEVAWAVGALPIPSSTPNAITGFVSSARNDWKGTVSIKSNDPLQPPTVSYWSRTSGGLPVPGWDPTSIDMQHSIATLAAIREWCFKSGLCEPSAPENVPNPLMVPFEGASYEQWSNWAMTNIASEFHMSSTCRMAPSLEKDWFGVVDPELKMYRCTGVRIVDCSIYPRVPSTHPTATAVMVGERAAYFIKGWSKKVDPKLNPATNKKK